MSRCCQPNHLTFAASTILVVYASIFYHVNLPFISPPWNIVLSAGLLLLGVTGLTISIHGWITELSDCSTSGDTR